MYKVQSLILFCQAHQNEGQHVNYNGPGTNPLGTIAEGFRRIGDAALSLVSATAEVFVNATRTEGKASAGNTTFSVSATTSSSAYVSFNFSDVLNPPANNTFVLPKDVVTLGVKTTVTSTEKLTSTVVVDGVPINISTSSTQSATDQSVTNMQEVSVGVDKENLKAKMFVNSSTTTDSNGQETSKSSAGLKVESPVYQEGKTTISVGTQLKLEHELR